MINADEIGVLGGFGTLFCIFMRLQRTGYENPGSSLSSVFISMHFCWKKAEWVRVYLREAIA